MTILGKLRHLSYQVGMRKHEATTTINISLPVTQRRFVEAEVAQRGYASVSEYFRELLRERQRAQSSGLGAGGTTGTDSIDRKAAHDAVRRILELQQQLSLKGLSIEQLINDGRGG